MSLNFDSYFFILSYCYLLKFIFCMSSRVHDIYDDSLVLNRSSCWVAETRKYLWRPGNNVFTIFLKLYSIFAWRSLPLGPIRYLRVFNKRFNLSRSTRASSSWFFGKHDYSSLNISAFSVLWTALVWLYNFTKIESFTVFISLSTPPIYYSSFFTYS